jgi:hypothetical protein
MAIEGGNEARQASGEVYFERPSYLIRMYTGLTTSISLS